MSFLRIFYLLGFGGFFLWLGSEVLIKGAVDVATQIGISERVISVSVIAFGTGIPELSTSIVAILNKEKNISIGNLIGSNIFDILGISDDEANEKFGFLMDAFKYGAPPHGGMAFGFDRIVMLLAGSNQIRDVIAFPKTTSATSLMDNSPSNVDKTQLDELGLDIKSS